MSIQTQNNSEVLNCHNWFILRNVLKLMSMCFVYRKINLPCQSTNHIVISKTRCMVNLFDKHLSYISNLNAYTQKYQCPACNMHFCRLNNMKRHSRKCQGRTKHQFPGGFYSPPKTIFDKLEEHGIVVPANERIFPWFLLFDFKVMLSSMQDQTSEKLTWTAEHLPISVSICSNVEGFKSPQCIVDPDTNSLVASMVQYMTNIANKSYDLAKAKFC